jgi:DNA-3-methyladenine glycosylase II
MPTLAEIQAHLAQDFVLKQILSEALPLPTLTPTDLYTALLRAIVYQQLSIKAAGTIWQRFVALFHNQNPSPDRLLHKDLPELRAVGLSQQKAGYMHNIAQYAIDNKWQDADFQSLADEEIITKLTSIKGVGRWTVEMLLIFDLNRPDVFPIADLGIRQTMVELYALDTSNAKKLNLKLLEIAANWQPYRTYASRYLWQWKNGK